MLKFLEKIKGVKATGVSCGFCGWNGKVDEVLEAKYMNQDSSSYVIKVCPVCQRNGGLVYHDAS